MSKKISELPKYTGAIPAVGNFPVSILGTTYRCNATQFPTTVKPTKTINLDDGDYTLQAEDVNFKLFIYGSATYAGQKIILPTEGTIPVGTIEIFNSYDSLQFGNIPFDTTALGVEPIGYINNFNYFYTAVLEIVQDDAEQYYYTISYQTDGSRNVLGKISIADKEGAIFTDIFSATAWFGNYYNLSLGVTDASFKDGVFYFTVPPNSTIGIGADNFCSDNNSSGNLEFKDPLGLITTFNNDGHFAGNIKSNEFGRILITGDDFLRDAYPTIDDLQGKNIIKQIVDITGINFARLYTGRIDIGQFGTTGGQELPTDIFNNTTNLAWITTPLSNKSNNSGNEDADIQQALTNGINRAIYV